MAELALGCLTSFGAASIGLRGGSGWVVEQVLRWEFAEAADAIGHVAKLAGMARSTAHYRVSVTIEPEREVGGGA